MRKLAGIGKSDRKQLTAVLRGTKGTVTVGDAARILKLPRTDAAKLLARWAQRGWLSRVRRGLYVPIPLEATSPDMPLEDPWLVAARLYSPCYIGGWSAAEYWDLTEQIFRTVVVMTTQRPRNRRPRIKDTDFLVRTVSQSAMFGLKPVWRGAAKVQVSDPSRTIVDFLNDPSLAGGLRPMTDMFRAYLTSSWCNLSLLLDYGDRLGNGAAFKRLGFLLTLYTPDDRDVIAQVEARLTTGNARLDSALRCDALVTRWRLWVPSTWKKELPDD